MNAADMISLLLKELGDEYDQGLALAHIQAETADLTHADNWPWREAGANVSIPSSGLVATPDDFGKVISLTIPALSAKLKRASEAKLRAQHAGDFNTTGNPAHYFLVGEALYVWRAPASTLSGRLLYQRNQLPLTADSVEADFLMPARDHHLIVEGALVRAFTEDDDFEKAGQWKAIQQSGLESAIVDWKRRDLDPDEDLLNGTTLQVFIDEAKLNLGPDFNEAKLASYASQFIQSIVHSDSYPFREKTADVTVGTDGLVTTPDDFGKVETLTIPEGHVKLKYQRLNRIKQWYPGTWTDPATCASRYDFPECYYFVGEALYAWRPPVRELTAELDYIADQPPLTAASPISDILLPAKYHSWIVPGILMRAYLDKGDVQTSSYYASMVRQLRADAEEELWLRQLDSNERVDYDEIDEGYNYELDEWC